MSFIIPSSLSDFIPSTIKTKAVNIENTSDLFFSIGEIESKQELPPYVIIRPDLIAGFDKSIRLIEKFKMESFTLIEDEGVTVNGLDMHWNSINLNDFLTEIQDGEESSLPEKSQGGDSSLKHQKERDDDEDDNTPEQF